MKHGNAVAVVVIAALEFAAGAGADMAPANSYIGAVGDLAPPELCLLIWAPLLLLVLCCVGVLLLLIRADRPRTVCRPPVRNGKDAAVSHHLALHR